MINWDEEGILNKAAPVILGPSQEKWDVGEISNVPMIGAGLRAVCIGHNEDGQPRLVLI